LGLRDTTAIKPHKRGEGIDQDEIFWERAIAKLGGLLEEHLGKAICPELWANRFGRGGHRMAKRRRGKGKVLGKNPLRGKIQEKE